MTRSEELFERAQRVLPGGVNSPVRAFRAVGGIPRFIKKASGALLTDVDGREYIDFVSSWGCMILGHNHPKVLEAVVEAAKDGLSFGAATEREVELAEKIVSIVPHIEMIRMVNSGTEAVMSALRLARAVTGRDKIIKFEGCYHGHVDSMLVKAGSGALTYGSPDSAGVSSEVARDTLVARYNDLSSVEQLIERNRDCVAAIILEPVAANMGVVLPHDEFLRGLRHLCDREGILLIFDEVITGFRLALGGAQSYFNTRADIVTFGKIIGGGLPVGAYGASSNLMRNVAPLGKVYQAGTLSGNPLAMAAGLATLQQLETMPHLYTDLEDKAQKLAQSLRSTGYSVNQAGSLLCAFMQKERVIDFKTALKSDTERYAILFQRLLGEGLYIAPAQFEALFLSFAHTEEQIDRLAEGFKKGVES